MQLVPTDGTTARGGRTSPADFRKNLRPEYKSYMKDDNITFKDLCEKGHKADVTMVGIKQFKTPHPKKTDAPSKTPTPKGSKTKVPDGKKAAATSSDTPKPARPHCTFCKIRGHTEDVSNKKMAAVTASTSSTAPMVPAKGVHMVQLQG